MVAAASFPEAHPFPDVEQDQHVILRDMCWQDYEAFLALRGDRAGVRMYYLDGEIEIMSPAKVHGGRKKCLARLLELWALETDVDLNGFGSWTLKRELRDAGAEPDECYILGPSAERNEPDLVIEIEWSRAMGLAKQEIYRRLGIRELWTLKSGGALVIRVLENDAWVESDRSRLLPTLDVAWLLSFVDADAQTQAVRNLRDALRAPGAR